MKYCQVTVKTSHDAADLVADVLFSAGCDGVSVKDKTDILELYKSEFIWDYVDESVLNDTDETVYVKAVLDGAEKSEKLKLIADGLSALKVGCVFPTGSLELTEEELDDEDWKNEWKKYYKPIKTSAVTVVPVWIKYKPSAGEKVLRINPGMAFGTGEHETTNMCLNMLGETEATGKSVIDVGTGSGILGIAAVLCGAESAYMCDIDGVCIDSANENARLNGVCPKVEIEVGDLLRKTGKKADLIFANITADILIRLSEGIAEHLNDGGKVILSGIIHSRLIDVKNAYSACGLRFVSHKRLGEWNALSYEKPD